MTNGQIRRGADCLAIAALTRVANATTALNGRIRIAEKSMFEAYHFVRPPSTLDGTAGPDLFER